MTGLFIPSNQIGTALLKVCDTVTSSLSISKYWLKDEKRNPIIVCVDSNDCQTISITVPSTTSEKELVVNVPNRNSFVSLPPSVEEGSIDFWAPVLVFHAALATKEIDSSVFVHEVIHMLSCSEWEQSSYQLFRKCGILIETFDLKSKQFTYKNCNLIRTNEFFNDYVSAFIHELAFRSVYDRCEYGRFSNICQKIKRIALDFEMAEIDVYRHYLLCSMNEDFVANVCQMTQRTNSKHQI